MQSKKWREWHFWKKVDIGKEPGDCWLWLGGRHSHGYGSHNRHDYAHRTAWELLVGPIPAGLTVDHLCRVRHCVNPAHMELVTNKENILRGESVAAKYARRSCCVRGHEFTNENTLRVKGRSGRICRKCSRIRAKNRILTPRQKARRTRYQTNWMRAKRLRCKLESSQ